MKKMLGVFFIVGLLLTGCNTDQSILKEYNHEGFVQESNVESAILTEYATLFATDLCVIPSVNKLQMNETLTAATSLLIGIDDKDYMYADNIFDRLYPASITKIVTALVILKYANLSDEITVSYNASHITESGAKLCGFSEGDKINLLDLLNVFLIYSGNDAGIAIAEHVSGSVEAFSKLMNEEVAKLGAVNSNFVNPHGLHSDDHYTTAYDLYLIFNEVIKDEVFKDIISKSVYELTYKDKDNNAVTKEFSTTNLFLTEPNRVPENFIVMGGKTGTTSKAGSCLILLSKNNADKKYISVILKAENRDKLFQQMSTLLKMANE